MYLNRPILKRSTDDVIYLNANYEFGQNWVDCGMSITTAYIKSLGFTSLGELNTFCEHINVFNTFSDKRLMKALDSSEDRSLLWEYKSFLNRNDLTAIPALLNNNIKRDFEVFNPTFSYFFQFIFTWVTGGDRLSSRTREGFIKWWNTQKNNYLSVSRYYYSPHTIRWIRLNETFPVLKPFKALVDKFLPEYRAGKYNKEGLRGVNDPADLVHQWQQGLLKALLKESKWKYTSGNSINAGAAIPSFQVLI